MATPRRQLGYVSTTITQSPVVAGAGEGAATGGTSSSITVSGTDYTLLTFTSSSTLTVTKAGLFDILVCDGGGAGSRNGIFATKSAGGGGAGGLTIFNRVYLDANQTVTIGAGGAGTSSGLGANGNPSKVGPYQVAGGARGGIDGNNPGAIGGSTGGSTQGGYHMDEQGNAGNYSSGGGGGGKGSTPSNQNGGDGYDVSTFIAGSTLYKSGGGAGCAGGTTGSGGSGVGGNSANTANGGSAAANTASGGGGANEGYTSGSGGSGIVYVRFKV